MRLRRIYHFLVKEFIQAVRDPRLRLFLFMPPLVQLMMYGYAINFDIQRIPTAVFDEARTPQTRDLINRFASNPSFSLDYYLDHPGQIRDLLDRGKATFALRLSYDFARNLKEGKPAAMQLIIDGTDSNAALIVGRYANTIINDYSLELLQERMGRRGLPASRGAPVVVEEQTWFNKNRISHVTYVPGVIAMVVMLVSIMLTALSVVREKEMGTMEQLLVAPIRPVEFILGKTIPFVLISLMDVVLVTLVAIFWFEVPLRGSPPVLLLGTLLFLISTVGLGLFISTMCSTQQQAMMVSTFVFLPTIMLSGLVFPIPNMPVAVQYLTYLNPLSYFIIIIQDVFLKGVGVAVLWPQMAGLAVLGTALLGLSVLRFRQRLA
ncbi:MAG: ABC transporter permease [Deltaproteobacteria bacterium]|nr:MAG: ABC transporter permease [Deltaproteobacteria bacterium]